MKTKVYFSLKGDNLDIQKVTKLLGIEPSDLHDKSEGKPNYNFWELAIEKDAYFIEIYEIVEGLVEVLYSKISIINEIKVEYSCISILEIVFWIDSNPTTSNPALSFNNRVIDFLYKTGTEVDVDIYKDSV